MLCHVLLALDFQEWATWTIPLAGLSSAGIALFAGKLFFGKRTKPLPLPQVPNATQSEADPFDTGSADERRQAFRRGNRLTKILISAPALEAGPFTSWVADRSVSGLGLLLDKPVPEGAILSLRTADAPSDTPGVDVRVQWCRAKDGQCEVGCSFVRSPAWSVLMLFG